MSRHTVQVKANTKSGAAILAMGYDSNPYPHFFCTLAESAEQIDEPLWSSIFSLEYMRASDPDDFNGVLAGFGVTIPDFIKKALVEDWAKRQMNVEYFWHEDGTMEQMR